ncbi:hypothetical protein SUGI_0572590 [Cryptomeria japonica]|nr:hypothetical protein SUGI_0572590 [Cryptomeria japonica]
MAVGMSNDDYALEKRLKGGVRYGAARVEGDAVAAGGGRCYGRQGLGVPTESQPVRGEGQWGFRATRWGEGVLLQGGVVSLTSSFREVAYLSVVDVLESKERCLELIRGFVKLVNEDAVVDALVELQDGTKESILWVYFNPSIYYSSESKEESEMEDLQEENVEQGREDSDGSDSKENEDKSSSNSRVMKTGGLQRNPWSPCSGSVNWVAAHPSETNRD